MAEFSETLLGCFGNSSLTCLGCYAPLFVFGKNAEKMGENPILWMAGMSMLPCIVGAYMRGMIRRKQGIQGDFSNDCCTYLCCAPCAIIQEARQLQSCDYFVDQPEPQVMERTSVN